MSWFERVLKFFASIRLAVFIILALATISGIGTIYEARYNAYVAQELVYHSYYMYAILGLLAITLTAVMVDRWPWRRHHLGFILAHVGILVLLLGSYITQRYGVDGSMTFHPGDKRHFVTVTGREVAVFSSLDGTDIRPMFDAPVDFLQNPPSTAHPYIVHLGQDEIRFVHAEEFTFRNSDMQATDLKNDGPAIRFELPNSRVTLTEWLRRDDRSDKGEMDLGPAKVVLADTPVPPSGRNEIVLVPERDHEHLRYLIYNKDNSLRKSGRVKQSETIDTGWMGLQFRLLRYLPHSKEVITYTPGEATPAATPAVEFTFKGKTHWLGLDTVMTLFLPDRMYWVTYSHRQLNLNFALKLKSFNIGYDQGTKRAASYASLVEVPGRGDVTISMNNPLKYKGFTFYQSSFDKDQNGNPTASIFTVNYDPGRWVKYFGSFLIVLGCIVLFYFKRAKWFPSRKRGES